MAEKNLPPSRPSSSRQPTRRTLWAIVLAGGEGERLGPIIRQWLGYHCPKQYCTFVGRRSMVQHTLDRARQLVHPNRIVTVIARGHASFLKASLYSEIPGRVIEQPANRDTAPGIFLPATYIMATDPSATILIFPTDHFIFPEDRFLLQVVQAGLLAESLDDRLLLLGAIPDYPESEYGWIAPSQAKQGRASSFGRVARDISSFREKPSAKKAEEFFRLGYLWNTMIMAVRIKTLWALGHRFFPPMMTEFETLLRVLRAIDAGSVSEEQEQLALSHIYQNMGSVNFSRDLLQQASEHTMVFPMNNVQWSDWGRPARVSASLARIGKKPYFVAA